MVSCGVFLEGASARHETGGGRTRLPTEATDQPCEIAREVGILPSRGRWTLEGIKCNGCDSDSGRGRSASGRGYQSGSKEVYETIQCPI